MTQSALGWLITVQLLDGSPPQVYNVAIASEREAINAVKDVLPEAKGAIIKVKSELSERVYKALKMKSGDVLAGAQPQRKPKRKNLA